MKNSEFEDLKEGTEETLNVDLIPLDIGSSSTSRVYKTKILGKWIFVKELKPELRHDARLEAVFLKEMEIGFQLDHPGLPHYILINGILPEGRYVASEYIDGLTLDQFLKQNPHYFADSRNLRKFISEMGNVLDYLHSRQILHLDIKPSNVMITRVGQNVKLIDLGFCQTDAFRDTAGQTPAFQAPERKKTGGEKSAATDFYGLGLLLKYIRENTDNYPQKAFRRVEEALLTEDASVRPSDREAVEKLQSEKRKISKWVAYTGLIIMVATGVFIFINSNEGTVEGNLESTIPEYKTKGNIGDAITEKAEVTVGSPQTQQQETSLPTIPTEPVGVPLPAGKSSAQESGKKVKEMEIEKEEEVPAQSYRTQQEEFLKELRKNITASYEPIASRLKKAIREENYTEPEYKAIDNLLNNASHTLMKSWSSYKQKYPHLSDDYIQDMTVEEMETGEYRLWKPDWDKYKMEYLRRSKGAGNN